jgi:hypothetical protein
LHQGLCQKSQGDCNFEYGGLCGWENVDDDIFDWLLHQGPTET